MMSPYFREIRPTDIPAIKQMTKNIWEGEDYIPQRIENWLHKSEAIHIGLFLDEETTAEQLIGFGRIRIYPNGIFWLEAGRIHPDYQQKGYGRQLTEFCIQYSEKHGAKRIQYDTWASRDHIGDPNFSQNHGSIALASHFGFHKKFYIDSILAKQEELELPREISREIPTSSVQPIAPQKVLTVWNTILGEVPSEINHGWNYFPAIPKIILNLGDHVTWWHNEGAICQLIHHSSTAEVEVPDPNEVWFVVYGTPFAGETLVNQIIKSHLDLKKNESITIFCLPAIADRLFKWGFHPYEEEPSGVVLFEKICS